MTDGQDSSPLRDQPPLWLVAFTAAVALFYRLVLAVGTPGLTVLANTLGPLALAIATGLLALRLFLGRPTIAWTAYGWSLLSLMAFFCVGPLIYTLGGPRAVEYALSFLPLDERDLLRTNLLTAVGITFFLLGIRLARRWGEGRQNPPRESFSANTRLKNLALVFLVLGGLINLTVMYPLLLGLTRGIVSGVLINLGDTYLLGLLILVYLVARGERRLLLPLVLLWIPQILVTLASFNKGQLVLSIMIPALGAYLARPTFTRLTLTALLVLVTIFFTERMALWGRTEYSRLASHPRTVLGALGSRLGLAGDYVAAATGTGRKSITPPRAVTGSFPSYALAWGRFNYAPEEGFAMRLYDEGSPGHTLAPALYIFVPRLLWPGKPNITNAGVDFYRLASGHSSSSLGLGIFGEGYWNDGWMGVAGIAFLTGLALAVMSNLSARWIDRKEFQYLPCILLGLETGATGLTGLFVTAIMGAGGFFAAYALASYGITQILDLYGGRKRTAHERSSA